MTTEGLINEKIRKVLETKEENLHEEAKKLNRNNLFEASRQDEREVGEIYEKVAEEKYNCTLYDLYRN